MADEVMELSQSRGTAGHQIIDLTDRVGLNATGAGWEFTEATGAWRFYLFTTMVDTKGPLWIWERLATAFNRLRLPDGITPLDIVVDSPNGQFYRGIPIKLDDNEPIFHGGGDVSVRVVTGRAIDDRGDYFFLLRSRQEVPAKPSIAQRDAAARRFDTKVRQLVAA